MLKLCKGPGITILVLLVLSLLAACAPPQTAIGPPPNLDPKLYELMLAENRGEAETFAKPRNIQLIDGSVRVIIEALPGQAEAAAGAAKRTGARIEITDGDILQAVVPIRKLASLAEAKSIRSIDLPRRPASDPPRPG